MLLFKNDGSLLFVLVMRDKMDKCASKSTKMLQGSNNTDTKSDFSSYDSVKDPIYKKSVSSSSTESTTSSSGSGSSTTSSSSSKIEEDAKNKNEDVNTVLPNESPTPEKKRRGRKRKADPSNSIKATAKRLRNAGFAYISNSKKNKVTIPERKMGPPCTEKCKLKCCLNITECQRQQIFSAYWQLGCLQRQREFISSNILAIEPKYSYRSADSNRAKNNAFYFTVEEKRIRVCKPFFRSTLGISDRPIRTVISKRKHSPGGIVKLDLRGNHGNHKKIDISIKNGIRKHIESVPTIESHYCRADTSKEYIDGEKSVAELHNDYVTDCKERQEPYGNYILYYRIFNSEYNISFFQPKKDQCDDCTAYFNASEEDKITFKPKYDSHHEEKKLSREEKEKDKTNTDETLVVAVYDLQGTLPCPRGEVSTFYYVSKINTFNFTIYDLKTNAVQCFVWHEGQGNRGINEIGSCVYKYLESLQEKVKNNNKLDVIFFSDNCCGQQKNHFMIALYLYAISNLKFLNSITHKFLIKGHTQNEGDNAHSIIERRIKRCLKSGPIYTPHQYINLIRIAKNKNPYQVHEMCYESFYDIKSIAPEIGHNYSKDTDNNIFKLTEVKVLQVKSSYPDAFFYKHSYKEKNFKKVEIIKKITRSNKKVSDFNSNYKIKLKRAYKQKIAISEKKKSGLTSLLKKNIIPKFYEDFYANL